MSELIRKWPVGQIVILARNSLAMDLEQVLAKWDPSLETRIDSFTEYDDAFNFTKGQKNVALVVLDEAIDVLNFKQMYDQLLGLTSEQDVPAYAAVIYENIPSIKSMRTIMVDSRVLDYCPLSDFLNETQLPITMNGLWLRKSKREISDFISPEFASFVIGSVEEVYSSGARVFHERCLNILGPHLSLSSIDQLAVKWAPYFRAMKDKVKNPLSCKLGHIILKIEADKNYETLPARLLKTLTELGQLRSDGTLVKYIQELHKSVRPSSNTILRLTARYADSIILFASETSEESGLSMDRVVG